MIKQRVMKAMTTVRNANMRASGANIERKEEMPRMSKVLLSQRKWISMRINWVYST
jgi:hypothetical protein